MLRERFAFSGVAISTPSVDRQLALTSTVLWSAEHLAAGRVVVGRGWPNRISELHNLLPATRWYMAAFAMSRRATNAYLDGYHDITHQVIGWVNEMTSGSAGREVLGSPVSVPTVHAPLPLTYVGPPLPRVLLVGEDRGCASTISGDPCPDGVAHHVRHAPALMPYPSTDGFYLLNALDSAAGLHVDLGLMNGCDVDDLGAAHRLLGEPHVVALGVAAAQRCEQLGIKAATVPHPRYVRRFHYRFHREYGRLLQRALADQIDALDWRPR